VNIEQKCNTDRGKRRTQRKTHPSATLSTNPTWTVLGVNTGLCGEKPATIFLYKMELKLK
jgi:hypothetical protein